MKIRSVNLQLSPADIHIAYLATFITNAPQKVSPGLDSPI